MPLTANYETLVNVTGAPIAAADVPKRVPCQGLRFDPDEVRGGELFALMDERLAESSDALRRESSDALRREPSNALRRAFERGAGILLVPEHAAIPAEVELRYVLRVPNVVESLGKIARWWLHRHHIARIAVLGAVGKTSLTDTLVQRLLRLGRGAYVPRGATGVLDLVRAVAEVGDEHGWIVAEFEQSEAATLEILDPTVFVSTPDADPPEIHAISRFLLDAETPGRLLLTSDFTRVELDAAPLSGLAGWVHREYASLGFTLAESREAAAKALIDAVFTGDPARPVPTEAPAGGAPANRQVRIDDECSVYFDTGHPHPRGLRALKELLDYVVTLSPRPVQQLHIVWSPPITYGEAGLPAEYWARLGAIVESFIGPAAAEGDEHPPKSIVCLDEHSAGILEGHLGRKIAVFDSVRALVQRVLQTEGVEDFESATGSAQAIVLYGALGAGTEAELSERLHRELPVAEPVIRPIAPE